ncbi:MAG: hypothetical protein IPN29_04675 [Saprospiraceae bacterium]|nr:hypothetical protein [Saprospiraceae bacterium]
MEKLSQFSFGRTVSRYPKPIAFTFLLFSSLFGYAQTNGAIACNDLVQVSLDADCQAEITPDMILEGTYNIPWSQFSVKISNVIGTVVTKPGYHSVTVTNTNNGNSCWGNISVEDKLPPAILECPCAEGNDDPDCHFLCSDEDGIKKGTVNVPLPVVDENCGSYTINVTDKIIDNGCQGTIFKRTYIYKDNYGNASPPCVSYFYLDPVTLADVTPPVNIVQLTCGAKTSPQDIYNFLKPTLGDAVARTYAWPTINGVVIGSDGPCNLAAAKTDSELLACGPLCSDSKKVIRTWTVLDWCEGTSVNFVQIIKATDNQAPTVVAKDITVSTDPWGCTANVTFPDPQILHDNCSSIVSYRIEGQPGQQIVFHQASNSWLALNVPKGDHQFYYKATDCCDNVGIDTITVSVRDLTSPVAISKEFIVVSLTNSGDGKGTAKIYAASIDNGSHDGCTGVKLELRRDEDKCNVKGNATYNADGHSFDGSSDPNSNDYDPDNGAFIKFCCADLTGLENGVPFGIVKVWLRVWDDGDMNNVYGSAGDNYNETWSYVRVEDKLAPTLVCPKDITLECDQDYKNLDVTGKAYSFYTCGTGEVEYSDNASLNSCGSGTVRRKWWVKGHPQIFCYQSIYVKPTPPATVTVIFPKDITTDCKNLPNEPKPIYSGGACNLLGYSLQSDTFFVEEGACMKILNKFTVIDWCTYEPNNPQSGGIWTGTQVIKVLDDSAPVLTCQDQMFEVNDNADADGDGNKCELKSLILTNVADDNGDCASKWLKWIVLVDLWGDGNTDYEYTSFISPSDLSFTTDSNLNGIPDRYLSPTSSGQEVSIVIPEDISGSMSNHKIQWKVSDGCGNLTSCSSTFMVVDKKKPTPYCISLSTALMINGTVELWARDFDKGSFDNCTKSRDLLFTFAQAHPVLTKLNVEHYFKGKGENATVAEFNAGDAQRWVPASKSSSKIFNCDDLPQADVEMTVWDEKLNFDYCNVTLTLLDNQGACGGTLSAPISGTLRFIDAGINQAAIQLNGASNTITKTIKSDNSGAYMFPYNPMYLDYTISASKNDDPLNGVSTLDLVMIQRHILGISKFDNAENIIAADINADRKISATDLVELRKVILGILPNFSGNQSWKFIDVHTPITNQLNPWPLDETIDVNQLDQPISNQDFKGIKIGDVNKNAVANLNQLGTETRSGAKVNLVADDMEVIKGNNYQIQIPLRDLNMRAVQFALHTEGLSVNSIEFDEVVSDEFYHITKDGTVLISWNSADDKTMASMLTIDVTATSNGSISDMMYINDNALKATMYAGESLEETDLQLVFRKLVKDTPTTFEVYQNEPNPFKDMTTISFYLPQAQEAVLTVFDVTGRQILRESRNCLKGLNAFTVNMSSFEYSGVMYYQIESGDYAATKVMIGLK